MCDKLLLSVKEAAERLRLGRSLTYRFIQTGKLPSVKIGGARRVAVADLEAFVRSLKESASEG